MLHYQPSDFTLQIAITAGFVGYNAKQCLKGIEMDVINLKEAGAQIPNLYQYEVIAKMNNHNFTIVRVKDRTLDFHTHPD